MKKIITLIITVLLIFSCFTLTTFATETFYDEDKVFSTTLDKNVTVTFGNDLRTLYFGKEKYVRFSDDNVYDEVLAELSNKIELSSKHKKEIRDISLTANQNGILIDATIDYKDGAYLESSYIKQEYLEEYKRIIASDYQQCEVDFYYPENNVVELSADVLSGEQITIENVYESIESDFTVLTYSNDKKLSVAVGSLLLKDDEFYYVSYAKIGKTQCEFNVYDEETITAYKITDLKTVTALEEALSRYYEDDFGFLFDDNFTANIADIFIVLIFCILPLAAFVVFVILAIRSKGIYRKLNVATCIISGIIVAIFTLITSLVK